MALRFNPPPNWPAPPEGFVPPAGWQPDPAWGPAPEGWQLWVEDSGDASPVSASAPGTSDPAWAPTQAVQTGQSGPVADPTGQSASAPSADYASTGLPAPMGSSAPGSPYAAEMNYAQAPTPFHGQGQSTPATGGGWGGCWWRTTTTAVWPPGRGPCLSISCPICCCPVSRAA